MHSGMQTLFQGFLIKCLLSYLQENLQQWLTDEKARDQFVIRSGSDTEVLWNDARQLKPDPVYKRAVSCHHHFAFSLLWKRH